MANFGRSMDFMHGAAARSVPGMHAFAQSGNGHSSNGKGGYDSESNHHLVSKSKQERFETVLEALHGGTPNAILSWVMLLVSVAITIFAIFWHDLTNFQKCFAASSMFFCMAQSFAVVELLANITIRDIHMVGSNAAGGGGSQNDYKKYVFMGTDFAGGPEFYQILVPAGLFGAFTAFVWGMLSMPDAVTQEKDMTPDKLLLLLAVVCNTTASVNLASVMRDHFDAEAWGEHHADSAFNLVELMMENCIALSIKRIDHCKMLYMTTLCASVFCIVVSVAHFGGVHHGLGMCLVGACAMMASTWKLALVVEDDDDDPSNNETSVSVGAFLVALAITCYGLYAMPFHLDVKLTMVAGIISGTQSAFCFSKMSHKEKRLAHYMPRRRPGHGDEDEDE